MHSNELMKFQIMKTKKYLIYCILFANVFFIYALIKYVLGYNFLNIPIRETIILVYNSFITFTPTPNFLSSIAGFEAVIIAFAIPLSFEIVSRISERYQSEVISKRFIQDWIINWLPIILIANIVLAVSLRFFVQTSPSAIIWKVFAWITFIGFIFVAFILFKFLGRLKRYITDTEFVLRELFDEAERLLK